MTIMKTPPQYKDTMPSAKRLSTLLSQEARKLGRLLGPSLEVTANYKEELLVSALTVFFDLSNCVLFEEAFLEGLLQNVQVQ